MGALNLVKNGDGGRMIQTINVAPRIQCLEKTQSIRVVQVVADKMKSSSLRMLPEFWGHQPESGRSTSPNYGPRLQQ